MNIASASQSRPQGPVLASRTPTLSSNYPSRPQKSSTQSSSTRNFLVFPVQLDHRKSPSEAFPFTSYTTTDLEFRHHYDPNLSQGLGDIWVKTASYYKQKQNPQHEFIVFSVATSSGMQNFMALDRNVSVQGSSTLLSRSNKNAPMAQDYFHISHYGNIESLINHCAHTTSEDMCTHVEQVVFGRKEFSFAELLVLANTVSNSCPSYQLDAANCYWFASLIWECMLGEFEKGMIIHKKHSDDRGRFKGFRIQGNHSNFVQVMQKYKEDIAQFKNDVLSVGDRRSRKMSTMTHNRPDLEKLHASNGLVPPVDTSRSRTVSTSSTVSSANGHRSQVTEKENKGRSDRTRANSMYPSVKSQDPSARLSLNKDLPSLPPSAPTHQPPRSRTHPVDDRRRDSRVIASDHDIFSAPLPDAVTKGSNRYSDIGKSFEQATAAYNQPFNRPASSCVVSSQKQVQFETSPGRIPESARLKVISLPSRPSSPGSDPNKDRTRAPSLPVGPAPPDIKQSDQDSRNSISQPSVDAPRVRTTSGLQRLKRALPKLLLPTVRESEDAICESPELSSWTEIDSPEYEEDHPYADGASERLSFIEFPQPPANGPPGLSPRQIPSSPPGIRVAQGHRVHPSRVEYADGSRKRKSHDSASEESDSKSSAPRF
ncbi:hypothetical protein RSOLAG22IIIB_08530 [Rhizoctonia solani]|uniref:Uncharacterized protein n=1 Tax=Rhizoctonia solani TaxID=456999 RepID=A0A0K6FU23_9AGAM|nr:hypothetical protein RSOLAG22IIIB_08530 [Rhizoctonia solani]